MAVDDSKLNYSSEWDIDQLVYTGEVAVNVGAGSATTIFSIPAGLPSLPVFNVQLYSVAVNLWFSPGQNSLIGDFANGFSFYTYLNNGTIYLVPSISLTGQKARYFVWSDKVDH
jgi:hypothetical protein